MLSLYRSLAVSRGPKWGAPYQVALAILNDNYESAKAEQESLVESLRLSKTAKSRPAIPINFITPA